MLSVKRDPFARGEYIRTCRGAGTCQWCGQQRKRVYSYHWEDNSARARLNPDGKTFCNFGCFQSYNC